MSFTLAVLDTMGLQQKLVIAYSKLLGGCMLFILWIRERVTMFFKCWKDTAGMGAMLAPNKIFFTDTRLIV